MRLLEILTDDKNTAYRVGDFKYPSETLKGRGWNFKSTIGYLGTGYYFVSTLKGAIDIKRELGRTDDIYKIDLTSYNLYRPSNPVNFYQDIKSITANVGLFAKENLMEDMGEESYQEMYDIVKDEHGLNIAEPQFRSILSGFISDVYNGKDGTLLMNRLLEPLGYDGIDNGGVEDLDNYGVGSIIFQSKFDPKTAQIVELGK
jgi:hypothetical protein